MNNQNMGGFPQAEIEQAHRDLMMSQLHSQAQSQQFNNVFNPSTVHSAQNPNGQFAFSDQRIESEPDYVA